MARLYRVAAFVSHLVGYAVLEQLLRLDGAEPVLVVTDDPLQPFCNAGRRLWRYSIAEELRLLVSRLAERAGLPVHTGWVRDQQFLRSYRAAAPGVIVSAVFGQKIPRQLLEAVEHRAWNLHPVLAGLPLETTRGPGPFEKALGLGAESMQWCLHQMTEVIDRGEEMARSVPFFLPRENEFTPESYLGVQQQIAPLAAKLVRETLPKLLLGECEPALVNTQIATPC
jgi:methionyl-tRNA formyltransferase